MKISHINKHLSNINSNQVYIEIGKTHISIDNFQVLVNGQSIELPLKRDDFEVKKLTQVFLTIEGK